MKTFKEYLEHRDLELYNEIDWQHWKKKGKDWIKKGVVGAALAGGILSGGNKAFAPNQEKVPYDFGRDSLLVAKDRI